jgi:membrane protein DedA with SNARE-associated domain
VLIIAAVYAGTGRLNIWLVALVGFLAAILGDNVGFGIGHFGGRPLAERYGKYIFLTPERLDKTAEFFDRHGGKVIVIARFVEGLRQANGIIAGITGMHWTKFLPFNMLGAALWVGVWVSIGYFSGSNIDSIYRTATKYELYFGIAVGLTIVAWIGWRVWRHHARRRAKAKEDGQEKPAETEEPKATEDEQEKPVRQAEPEVKEEADEQEKPEGKPEPEVIEKPNEQEKPEYNEEPAEKVKDDEQEKPADKEEPEDKEEAPAG